MRALTTVPMTPHSLELSDGPAPTPGEGDLLVDGLAVGVCGTDKEIARGDYGWAPPGHDRLVIGHESLGQREVHRAGDQADRRLRERAVDRRGGLRRAARRPA